MAPARNKKKVSAASKSTSKDVISGMKRLKKGAKTGVASKCPSEEVVSETKVTEDKNDRDAVKESVPAPKVKKPCTWLKLDRLNPPIGSKSSLESCKQGKEAKMNAQVEESKDNKRKRDEKVEEKSHRDPNREKKTDSRPEKKEKEIINDRHEDRKRDEESEKIPGGLIFMCNAKTKPDCFRYQLMGVPASKKEVVMNVKPGLKMFLYDYDLKLMYGVFEASSAGGMKLEPSAFGGAFPAQVRFAVHKDCLPLPESVFKKAMKESYDERTRKFKTALTVKEVKNLIGLFSPVPRLRPNGNPVVEESVMRQRYLNNSDIRGKSIPLHHQSVPPKDPLFLTEQEYRNNGLRQGRPPLPTTAGDNVGRSWEPNKLDVELKQLLRPDSTTTDPAAQQREVNRGDPYFPGENEYRIYGLRGPYQAPNAVPPMMTSNSVVRNSGMDAYDPYDESTTALVNRYLSLPITTAVPAEPFSCTGRDSYTNDRPARSIPDGERASSYNLHDQSVINDKSYSLNASREPSVFNQGVGLQRETDMTYAPVSNRYSFAGPSLSQHR